MSWQLNPFIGWPDAGRVENAGIKRSERIERRGRNGSYLVEMDNKAC